MKKKNISREKIRKENEGKGVRWENPRDAFMTLAWRTAR